jgi:hypothetical protein
VYPVHIERASGFDIPIETEGTLTGHIDFLQIRNGSIHIVDYKPNGKSERPISQLIVYALALSRPRGLSCTISSVPGSMSTTTLSSTRSTSCTNARVRERSAKINSELAGPVLDGTHDCNGGVRTKCLAILTEPPLKG